jgi:hypothetical protein
MRRYGSPLIRRVALGPAALVLLSLPGCGTAATKTTTVPPVAATSPPAAQRAVVGVLTSYEDGYSAHNASTLRAILSPSVERTGEGAHGCEHATGQTAVLGAYEAQWAAGASRYQLIGLSPQAVKLNEKTASVKLSYRIAPASQGTIAFRLAASGKQWLITNITASCHSASKPTPAPTPSSTGSLTGEGWHELQRDLVGTLVLQGGAEAYERISKEIESASLPGCSHQPTSGGMKACLLLYRSSEVSTISKVRTELAQLAGQAPGACASAIETARTLLERRQAVIEATLPGALASEYGWANTSHELEQLELPTGHLGDGLAACDPSGTGEVESEASEAPSQPREPG